MRQDPSAVSRRLAGVAIFPNLTRAPIHPPNEGCIIDRDASFVYDLHEDSTGHILAKTEEDGMQADDRWEAGAFE